MSPTPQRHPASAPIGPVDRLRTAFAGAILLLAAVVGPAATRGRAEEAPAGEVLSFTFASSAIFPGTVREYWVYVPARYDGKTPACVHVNQDGIQFDAPKVFDRLIHEGKMPMTIGVFVMHGRVPAGREGALDRYNRSYEYDGLGSDYARFLLDELLPDVETRKASDGRTIVLSKKGADRSIGGTSSGAIAAFTAAWERPDAFTRVFSGIGTYVGLRGGNEYPTLLRKTEPKPIRVFLQGGEKDLNIYGGDWWIANQAMERSLAFAGYEVKHAWGDGGHDNRHATEVFPAAMEWLWSGWPAAPGRGAGSTQLQEILLPGEEWRLVGEGYREIGELSVDGAGAVAFTDADGAAWRVGDDWKAERAKPGEKPATAGADRGAGIDADGAAACLSPDRTLLYVADAESHWVYSSSLAPNGAITNRQRYYHLHVPDDADDAGATGLRVDRDGRLWVATRMGLQVCDQAGRVNCIIPPPAGRVTRLCFAGSGFDNVVVSCGDKLYARKTKVRGMEPFDSAVTPAKPRL